MLLPTIILFSIGVFIYNVIYLAYHLNKINKIADYIIAFNECAFYYQNEENVKIDYNLNNRFIKAYKKLSKLSIDYNILFYCQIVIAYANMRFDDRKAIEEHAFLKVHIFEKNKKNQYCGIFIPHEILSLNKNIKNEHFMHFYKNFFTDKVKNIFLRYFDIKKQINEI